MAIGIIALLDEIIKNKSRQMNQDKILQLSLQTWCTNYTKGEQLLYSDFHN